MKQFLSFMAVFFGLAILVEAKQIPIKDSPPLTVVSQDVQEDVLFVPEAPVVAIILQAISYDFILPETLKTKYDLKIPWRDINLYHKSKNSSIKLHTPPDSKYIRVKQKFWRKQ